MKTKLLGIAAAFVFINIFLHVCGAPWDQLAEAWAIAAAATGIVVLAVYFGVGVRR